MIKVKHIKTRDFLSDHVESNTSLSSCQKKNNNNNSAKYNPRTENYLNFPPNINQIIKPLLNLTTAQ